MLLVRKARVTVVPAISLVMIAALTAGLVDQLWTRGESIVRLLPGFVLPLVGFSAAAVFLVGRFERRGERIHWGRLWLHDSEDGVHCAIRAGSRPVGNGASLDVELVVRGEPVRLVFVSRDGPKAQAKAQRIAEALGLPLEREHSSPGGKAGSTKRGRRDRGRRKKKRQSPGNVIP